MPARVQTEGPAFLEHLVDTVEENTHRRGVVQAYSVLSGDSVTEGTPGTTTSKAASTSCARSSRRARRGVGNTDEQELADAGVRPSSSS